MTLNRENSNSLSNTSPVDYRRNGVYLSHPRHVVQKFIALLLMCLASFGSYLCYDNPAALEDNFVKDMSLSISEFLLLYSVYLWPNVICCLIGGFLLDRFFGIRFGTSLYCFLVFVGQFITGAGAYTNSLFVTVIGRFIFGVSNECLFVALSTYAVIWFKKTELNMIFGFELTFGRVASTINFALMESIYEYSSKFYDGYRCLGVTLFTASVSCLLSLASATILAWLDKRAERFSNRQTVEPEEIIRLSNVKKFPFSFWITTVILSCYYATVYCFISLGKLYFKKKFDFGSDEANYVNGLLYLISALLSPTLGFIIDRIGRNIFWLFISLSITLVGHMLLTMVFYNPYTGMTLIGIGFSIFGSTIWSTIALTVPECKLGTAFGIALALQNGGEAIVSLISGYISDTYGYFVLEMLFVGCLIVALLLVTVIWIYDANTTGLLNMSTEQRSVFERTKR